MFSFILISTKVWLFAWWLFGLFLLVSWVILNKTSVHVSPCIRSCLVMTRHLLVHCVTLEIFVPGLWSPNSNFWIYLQLWASEFFAPAPSIYVFLNPAPEWFGPLNTKTIVLFIQLACPTNCLWNQKTNFRYWLHHLKVFNFSSNSSHPKLLVLQLLTMAPKPSILCCWCYIVG